MPWIVVWCQVVGGVSEGVVWDWGGWEICWERRAA